ncbi:glycosyltransferase, partial [bacterium]|nr:glycosyltransferase [bacterium]
MTSITKHLTPERTGQARLIADAPIDVSVIIASYNSQRTILKALSALALQRTGNNYEIIVVDSSNDGTPEVVKRSFPEVRLIRLPRQTYPGSGRNLGVKHARGRYVAFTDADCVPEPDWIDNIVKTFTEVNADAVGGCLINGYPNSLPAWVSHLIEF